MNFLQMTEDQCTKIFSSPVVHSLSKSSRKIHTPRKLYHCKAQWKYISAQFDSSRLMYGILMIKNFGLINLANACL